MTLLSQGFALRKELIDSGPMDVHVAAPLCVLFDNGSLRPEATLNLRVIALRLQAAIGVTVCPVSLLHSSAIAPGALGGLPAKILEPALRAWLQAGGSDILLLPLFFGPSAALTEYVPQCLEQLRREFPAISVRLGRWLVDPRNSRDIRLASMERRSGPEYDFCEPLLAAVLRRAEFARGHVVVARQFFSPGRHAGPAGDIADICKAAEQERPGLKTHLTGLMGGDPRLIEVLADRYREARASAPV